MLVACRLAGPSALETYYAGIRVGAQFGPILMRINASQSLSRQSEKGASPPKEGLHLRQARKLLISHCVFCASQSERQARLVTHKP